MGSKISTSEALVELRRGLNVFKAFAEAEKVLSALQSAEQHLAEISAATDKAKREHVSVTAQLQADIQTLLTQRLEAEAAARAAQDAAEQAGKEIVDKARTTLVDAKARAEVIVADARLVADKALVEAAHAADKVRVAEQELADIEARIARAKSKVSEILGA